MRLLLGPPALPPCSAPPGPEGKRELETEPAKGLYMVSQPENPELLHTPIRWS